MKRIAIIGANGYIGRNMSYLILQNSNKYDVYLYGHNRESFIKNSNYKQIDIRCKDSVKNIDFTADVIFIFSGKTGTFTGFYDYDEYIDLNEKSILNVLNEYKNQKSKSRIIFPSTRLIYKGRKGKLKESDEKEFKTIYAMNKFACENYLAQYHQMFGIEYTVFRICVPYGNLTLGNLSYGTMGFFINQARTDKLITLYGDGSLRRTFTDIQDICESMLQGAFLKSCANNTFNIGGEDFSLSEIAHLIAKKYNAKIKYIDWPDNALKIESGDTVFNDDKLQNCGVVPKRKFKDWLAEI